MGAFIVQQPNGLYCRFSTVVDCPTDWNMTREDYRELKAENARQDADFTLDHYLRPFEWLREYFKPMNMTEEEFENCLKAMEEPAPAKSDTESTTIYIVRDLDLWCDRNDIYGCFFSEEKAITELLDDYPDLTRDAYDRWRFKDSNNSRYFTIEDCFVM